MAKEVVREYRLSVAMTAWGGLLGFASDCMKGLDG